MINPDEDAAFPNNVVKCLGIVLPGIDPDVKIQKRPLRPTDPTYSIGVYGTLWEPNQESHELLGSSAVHPSEPTLAEYQIGIQSLIKDSSTDRALTVSSIIAKRIRSVVYRNVPLRVAFQSLAVSDGVCTERLKRWGIRSQRYMANDIEGTFVFISVMDFWIETETV